MHKHMFLHIVEALCQHDEYFQMKVDETGRSSISPLQKHIVFYLYVGITSIDNMDSYLRISETAI